MRLLCETASHDMDIPKIDDYIKRYYDKAKTGLSTDERTFLSNNNVKKETLIQLLQTGAHNYTASQSPEQTIGVSIILGAMLLESHGK